MLSPRLFWRDRWPTGVGIALLVDPEDESVLAFRPDEPATAWRQHDRIDLGDILPDLELAVDELLAALRLQ